VDLSDRALWELAAGGNGEAFGQLFDRHCRAVYNHCFRLTASWSTAEDLTSTTFLLAWRQRDRMRLANDSLRPWLLAVATNAARSERRALGRRRRLTARASSGEPPASDHADDVAERVDVAGAAVAVASTDRPAPAAPPASRPVVPSYGPETTYPPAPTNPSYATPPRVITLQMDRIPVDSALQAQIAATCSFHAPIRLAVRTPYSRIAVIAPGTDAFACGLAPDGGPGLGGAGSYRGTSPTSPMVAPVRTDGLAEQAVAENLFASVIQGKVISAVRRVTLTYDGHTVDATVGNGVYVGGALMQYGPDRPLPTATEDSSGVPGGLPNPLPEPVVRAYDAHGTLLYRWDRADIVDGGGHGDVSCAKGPGRCRYAWP
jgi:Sigma-70 region 2